MRTIATTLAAMLAMALAASAFAQTPKALGWERGQAVPASAIVEQGGTEGAIKYAFVKPVEGFDGVLVAYTDNLGVCAVSGTERFPSRRAYRANVFDNGRVLRARVASKFGQTEDVWRRLNFTSTTDAKGFIYNWKKDELPVGYRVIQARAREEHYLIRVIFAFDNHQACPPNDPPQAMWRRE